MTKSWLNFSIIQLDSRELTTLCKYYQKVYEM